MHLVPKSLMNLFGILLLTLSTSIWAYDWGTPVNVSLEGQDAVVPQIAIDANGNAVAVWQRFDGNNWIIQSSLRPINTKIWTTPVNVSEAGQNAFLPNVDVNPAGNAVAVWVRFDGLNWIVQGAILPFGAANWTPTTDLSAPGRDAYVPLLTFGPPVKVDAAGNAVAAWYRSDGINNIVQAATLPAGTTTWTPGANLSAPGRDAFTPFVAISPFGYAVVTWNRDNVTGITIQAATKPLLPFNGPWTPTNEPAGPLAINAEVRMDQAGNAVTIWRRVIAGDSIVQAARLPFGSSVWVSTTDLTATGTSRFQTLDMNATGYTVATWTRNDGMNDVIQGAVLAPGSLVWTPTTDLSMTGQDASVPEVAVNDLGDAVAVWQRFDGPDQFIQGSFLTFGSTVWGPAENISQAGQNSVGPKVSIDNGGNATPVWWRFSGTNQIVQSTQGSQFFAPLPPPNGSGQQTSVRVPTQTEYFNVLRWSPSPTAAFGGVLDYRIYRNGILIAQIPFNRLCFEDHLQRKGVRAVYTITAVAPGGLESAGLTIIVN